MGFSVRSLHILANGNDLAAFSNSELSIGPNAAICNELRIFDVTILFGLHAAGGGNRCIHQIQFSSADAVAVVVVALTSACAAGGRQRRALLALDRQLGVIRRNNNPGGFSATRVPAATLQLIFAI